MEEEFGTLQIRVYTSRAQLPIEDATVVVTQISPTGKYHLLSVQITDREGRVQPLTIPAPPRWESTGPTQDMVPFSGRNTQATPPCGWTASRSSPAKRPTRTWSSSPWPRGNTVLLTAPS